MFSLIYWKIRGFWKTHVYYGWQHAVLSLALLFTAVFALVLSGWLDYLGSSAVLYTLHLINFVDFNILWASVVMRLVTDRIEKRDFGLLYEASSGKIGLKDENLVIPERFRKHFA